MIILLNFSSNAYIFFSVISLFSINSFTKYSNCKYTITVHKQRFNCKPCGWIKFRKQDSLFAFWENEIGLFVFSISFTKVQINILNRSVERNFAFLSKCSVIYQRVKFLIIFILKMKTLFLFYNSLILFAHIHMKIQHRAS